MSYNIGQFRRTQRPSDSYMESYVEGTNYQLNSSYPTQVDTYTFNDFAIELANGTVLDALHSYHLRFTVYNPDREPFANQKITIRLKNENSETVQTIQTVTRTSSYSSGTSFEVMITPIATFKYIVFELERVSQDYTYRNANSLYGRKLNIQINSFGLIKNILADFIGLKEPLTKIGVQGPKGLIMCINGEEIKVGNSGFYEIDNGMKINYFGVILKSEYGSMAYPDGYQYFILDYQYEVKGE